MKKLYLIIVLFSLSNQVVFADNLQQKEINILKNLRCLVCQGQSIADSNSDFAQTIKLVIRDLINQNKDDQEIYNFLNSKYGQWILYKPKFNLNNFLLWFFPYFILLIGVFLIFKVLKKRKNS
ncbi:cytochrome c-type biogenesis protein CcmH [Pelagibacteraceae bacterium]|nr:cytochrome c-type biogenesis protein CcmH [Pelagibacteraceae bacterium]